MQFVLDFFIESRDGVQKEDLCVTLSFFSRARTRSCSSTSLATRSNRPRRDRSTAGMCWCEFNLLFEKHRRAGFERLSKI